MPAPSSQTASLPASHRGVPSPRLPGGGSNAGNSPMYQPQITEAWAEPPQPSVNSPSHFLPDIREHAARGPTMGPGGGGLRGLPAGFTLPPEVPSPESLRGEVRIRGLKNELLTAKNRFEQELQVCVWGGVVGGGALWEGL